MAKKVKLYDWDDAVEKSGLDWDTFVAAFESIGGYNEKKDDFTKKALKNNWATDIGQVTEIGLQAVIDEAERLAEDDEDEDEKPVKKSAKKTKKEVEVDAEEEEEEETELDDNTMIYAIKDYQFEKRSNIEKCIKLLEKQLAKFEEDEDEDEEDDPNKPGVYKGYVIEVKGKRVTATHKKTGKTLTTTTNGNIREKIDNE